LLVLPTSGTAFINGYEITKDDGKIRANIGLVTGEERSLYWRLTGRQNLDFFASLCNLSNSLAKQRNVVQQGKAYGGYLWILWRFG